MRGPRKASHGKILKPTNKQSYIDLLADATRKNSPSDDSGVDKATTHDITKAVYNLKNPENKLSKNMYQDEKRLGTGSFGSVYKTDKGVVKFDTTKSEPKLYQHIKTSNRLKNLKILPKLDKLSNIRLPERTRLTAISREDLDNLPSDAMTDRIEVLQNIFDTHIDSKRFRTGPPPREEFYNALKVWHNRNKNTNSLNKLQRAKLKDFAGGLLRLIHHGIIPQDIKLANLGQRKDGSIVLRDLSLYHVLDDPKKHQNIKNIIKRLKRFNR